MITLRILVLVLALLGRWISHARIYSCEEADYKEANGTCIVKHVTLLSPEEIDNATFPTNVSGDSLRMVESNVTRFSFTMARKLSHVKDLTVDDMGIRELVVWPTWEHLSAQNNGITNVTLAGGNQSAGLEDVDQFQLRTLYLQNNLLSTVPPLGKRFKQLKVLALDGNRLKDVSLGSFAGLEQLQTLSLANNRLIKVRMGENRKVQMLKLRHLSLAGNRLMDLDVSGWEMDSLQTLDLSGNGLFQLDIPHFEHLRALKELSYAGNEWKCEWLSAMQRFLKGKTISIVDREADDRCDKENLTSLQGICCYEPASKDLLLDLFSERWEQLKGLQRSYELVKFDYDRIELADINAINDRALGFRETLSGSVANVQDELDSTLYRLRSSLAEETARRERISVRIDRDITDIIQSFEDLYQRVTRPIPTLDAILGESLKDSIGQIDKNVKLLRGRIRDHLSKISAYETRIGKLDERLSDLKKGLAKQMKHDEDLIDLVDNFTQQVDAVFNLLDKKYTVRNDQSESFDSELHTLEVNF